MNEIFFLMLYTFVNHFKDLDTPQLHIVTDIKAYDVEKTNIDLRLGVGYKIPISSNLGLHSFYLLFGI